MEIWPLQAEVVKLGRRRRTRGQMMETTFPIARRAVSIPPEHTWFALNIPQSKPLCVVPTKIYSFLLIVNNRYS